MEDRKEQRKRNLVCALMSFNPDAESAENLFRGFRSTGSFSEMSAGFLAGMQLKTEEVASRAEAISNTLVEADDRTVAILSSMPDTEATLEKINQLNTKFRKELRVELPLLPMSIIVRFSQRGISPTIYQ